MVRKIWVRLSKSVQFLDYTKPKNEDWAWMKPGEYEVERVKNPRGGETDWFVFKDTTVGGTVDYFKAVIVIREGLSDGGED